MGTIRNFFKRTSPGLPEAEETVAVPDEIYVVAGDIQEYKMYLRVRKQYRGARWVGDISQLRGVRNALVIFMGSWTIRSDAVDLWENAQAGGNTVIEDVVL